VKINAGQRPFEQSCGVGSFWVESDFLTTLGVGVRFLTTLGVGVGFFCPTLTPDARLDHFLHQSLKLGISVKMVQFF